MQEIMLRDYQEAAIADVRLSFREKFKALLLILATGGGKTIIFSQIAKSAAEKNNNVLILAHRDQLIKQASRKLNDCGVRHGIIMAGFTPDFSARVQVASVQTLIRRLDKIRFKPKLIIIDEAHLSAAKTYKAIVAAFPDALLLGVTGSPCRLDGKSLGLKSGGLYDRMIQGISISELIARGFLVRPSVFAPADQLDLSGVHIVAGDYNEKELASVVDKPKITGSAVAHYKKICPDAPAVAWCVNLQHARHVAEEFNANGISTIMLCGEDSSEARDKALKALEMGEVKVITFVGILIEGVDCPAISSIILLRPTMSLSAYLQVIGRGLRPYTDRMGVKKTRCVVLDHAGLTFKHGLADEEREWELDAEPKPKRKNKKSEDNLKVIQCKSCFAVFDPAPFCPECGAEVVVKNNTLQHSDGELTEITPEMAEQIRANKRREVRNARTLSELERIGAERGYSDKWARLTFESKQKAREKYTSNRPTEPSLDSLKKMSLSELEVVAQEQGWPVSWPFDFHKTQKALGE